MKQFIIFLFFSSIIILSSCRKDFGTEPSIGALEFSKDTIFLDTVFTQIGSSTYRLKVYNRSTVDITVPSIGLENGENSGYRLNVDGLTGKQFENIDILAKDSIFIFIETTIDYAQVTNPLYEDKILFDAGENLQDVHLITLVQDAHFLYPTRTNGIIDSISVEGFKKKIAGRYLADNELTFTNEKPYVIYGYMLVGDENNTAKTLTVEAGAKVHFHANSGLIVNKNSSLHVEGSQNIEGQPETEVVFEGDRLEPYFAEVSGQWDYILLRNGSLNHQINYATIKNGIAGIVLQGITNTAVPVLEIYNSQIYNHATYGIFAGFTNIKGSNLVINNIGRSSFAGLLGGVYNFTHCTFANYWNDSNRTYPTLLLTNFIDPEEEDIVVFDLFEANFTNCIIYGDNNMELEFSKDDTAAFNYRFTNCLLKFNDTQGVFTDNALYDFDNTNIFLNNLYNTNPDFKAPQNNELIIGEHSAGNAQANSVGTTQAPTDIMGITRNNPADIGAYEHIIFED